MTGDALNLPFEDQTFDIVWGQDAWCHIPDKEHLIRQAPRVRFPGGCVAFTDWVEIGPMSADERKTLRSAMAAPKKRAAGHLIVPTLRRGSVRRRRRIVSAPLRRVSRGGPRFGWPLAARSFR